MYDGGACWQLTDPLSVWMKMEQFILLVVFTNNFILFDKAHNDNGVNDDDDVNGDDNNDNFQFLDGKHSIYNIYGLCI